MAPGFTFDLEDHYRSTFKRKYLTLDIDHAGNQTGFLISGIRVQTTEGEAQVYYRNYFTAIPSDVQFRPEAKTQKPRIHGTIRAEVDAGSGAGSYADLDAQGRYLVILPFDLSGHSPGKASCRIRMAQPYAGSSEGIHFPLHKGTEVLLTFVDGDPDRPLIAGAVPNAETQSPVREANRTMNVIQSAAGNRLEMEDSLGKERVKLSTPYSSTFLHLGAPPTGQPVYEAVVKTDNRGLVRTGQYLKVETGATDSTETTWSVTGAPTHGSFFVTAANEYRLVTGGPTPSGVSPAYTGDAIEDIGGKRTTHVKGDVQETYDKKWNVEVKDEAEIKTSTVAKKLTIHSEGDLELWAGGNVKIHAGGKKEEEIMNAPLKPNVAEWDDEAGHTATAVVGSDATAMVGASADIYFGVKSETFIGAKEEFCLAASAEFFLGEKFELKAILNQDVNLAAKLEVFLGVALAFSFAAKLEIILGAGFEIKDIHFQDSKIKFDNKGIHLAIGEAKIDQGTAKIDKKYLHIFT